MGFVFFSKQPLTPFSRRKVAMPGNGALVIVTENQHQILVELSSARSTSVAVATRSKIILLAFEKKFNEEIARQVCLNRNQVGIWRVRWREAFIDLVAVECSEGIGPLRQAIIKLLSDQPRSGRPPVITAEQRAHVASVACEKPSESGLATSHWTSQELADELIRRDLFESVSPASIRRILSEADLKPHRNRYWLNSPIKDTEEFRVQVRFICEIYAEAIEAYRSYGIHTICLDEQTGIQALERIAPDHGCRQGVGIRREYEYVRHGTTCLFGNFHVATGRLWSPLLRATRTEQDFVDNLHGVISQSPKDRFRIVLDNLNTHYSESCVRYVAKHCGVPEDRLGVKGKTGVLKDSESRKNFLSNPLHRVHFCFVPRHSSWLNQVEIWFGILRRKVTKLGNFVSVGNLENKILSFIGYYNEVMAHPFQWTYRGKPLCI
jgi:transposase